jgi:glucose-6-phosphate 1-dehydrogenase
MGSATRRQTPSAEQDTGPQRRHAACGVEPAPACTLVIFSAAGDLTKRLLIPALYDLAGDRLLKDEFDVVGIDHSDSDDDDWRAALSKEMKSLTKDPSAGSAGPASADRLLARDGRHWLALGD